MRHPLTQRRATALRKKPTDAEQRLWYHLRRRQLSAVRFRRQVPIGPFIADFASLEASLIIEVDGGQHRDNPKDVRRDAYLPRPHPVDVRSAAYFTTGNHTAVA